MILYMSQIDLASYKGVYFKTAKEYVGKISKSLSVLSKSPEDEKALSTLHISSHSLKSQSQVMGYNDIAKLSKSLEEISDNALKTKNPLTKDSINNVNKLFKELEKILKQVQDDTGKN